MSLPDTKPHIRLAVRNWDHLTPLLLGDVKPESFVLELTRVELTPSLEEPSDLDGAEASASHAALGAARGDDSTVPLPVFVLSAFRHRSFVVRRDSNLRALSELKGRRIGITAWPDTGNTLSRAVLREAGVQIDDVDWRVGPLTGDAPVPTAASFLRAPSNARPAERPLRDCLRDGDLDAVVVSFMPRDGYGSSASIRRLLADYRDHEIASFQRTSTVPGMHLLKLRRCVAERHPNVVREMLSLFARSYECWMNRRIALADTTPWMTSEFDLMADVTGLDWTPYSLRSACASMSMLTEQLYEQGVSESRITAEDVFASYFQSCE